MQIFDSVKMYVFMFCVLVVISIEKLRQLTESPVHAPAAGFDIKSLFLALITLYMAAYLALLLRKLSSRIEQLAIILIEVLCILWLADLLAKLGAVWAQIPHSRLLTAILHCIVTVLAGVRTFQVMWHRRQVQAA